MTQREIEASIARRQDSNDRKFKTLAREIRAGKRDESGNALTDAMRRADVRRGR
jgi:hypothetical protein